MFKKFPLFYIAFMYVFSTRDKIIFFMQQFAALVIALCIAVIICCFSVMNGFTNQAKDNFFRHTSPIIISSLNLKNTEINKDNMGDYNEGFLLPTLQNSHIKSAEFIRNQMTAFEINNRLYYGLAYENNFQSELLSVNDTVRQYIDTANNVLSGQNKRTITVIDPNSYNSLIGGVSRRKTYESFTTRKNRDDDNGPALFFSPIEYQKLFHNTKYNAVKIYLDDPDYANEVAASLKGQINDPNVIVNSFSYTESYLFETIQLQRKIFSLIYIIMFILLCSIIISSNVAFFKEKRKDWALLKILNPMPLSVERIFLYKNIISFILTTLVGVFIGVIFTVYSNEIINFMGLLMNNQTVISKSMFGTTTITYDFLLKDFLMIISFSFFIFLLNFVILISIFRKENIANFLKAP